MLLEFRSIVDELKEKHVQRFEEIDGGSRNGWIMEHVRR